MIIIASRNGSVGINAGWEVLERGGSALDAVEAATRLVEENPQDHTVGYGGYPNLLGEVELDASIMEGSTLRAGAVGALRGYQHPISVARRIMEELPHVMLVGEGASQFARTVGYPEQELLTDESRQTWRDGIEKRYPGALQQPPERMQGILLRQATRLATDPEHVTGTVNFIAQDRESRIASAVSTSGWAWKYPGRVGDSPVIGAGNYADDRYGAAACTGKGELALRFSTARSVVLYLKVGYSLEDACREAINDLSALGANPSETILSLVALDRHGNHCAVATASGGFYVYRTTGMTTFEQVPRLVISA